MVTALIGIPSSVRTVKRLFTCKKTWILRQEKLWILDKIGLISIKQCKVTKCTNRKKKAYPYTLGQQKHVLKVTIIDLKG